MNNYYIVFTVDGSKAPALFESIAEGDKNILQMHANICSTKKRAREIADAWNEGYKKNGTYLFS